MRRQGTPHAAASVPSEVAGVARSGPFQGLHRSARFGKDSPKNHLSPAACYISRSTRRRNALVQPGFRRHLQIPLPRSEEHTSELQSLMRISYAVFCLKKKNNTINVI